MNLVFKLRIAFCQFQTITVSQCCLIKLLPYVLFEKYIYILAVKVRRTVIPSNKNKKHSTTASHEGSQRGEKDTAVSSLHRLY